MSSYSDTTIEAAQQVIRRLLRSGQYTEQEQHDPHHECSWRFETSPGADYYFEASVAGGGVQVGATRCGAEPSEWFWYRPFEEVDYPTEALLDAAFCDGLRILLTHETRITQRRGFLSTSFDCEFRTAEGWQHFSSGSVLFDTCAPSIEGDEFVYHSPAIVSLTPAT